MPTRAQIGKVFIVGATDERGPNALGWEMHDSVISAVDAAKKWLAQPDAQVTYFRAPPAGYVKVKLPKSEEREEKAAADERGRPQAAASA